MALYSADFCNKWLRSTPRDVGMVSISGTFAFWGWVFIAMTTAIVIGKREQEAANDDGETPPPTLETYKTMVRIFLLRPVRILLLLWFTCKIGSAASGEIAMLKLTERGVSRANMALLSRHGLPYLPPKIGIGAISKLIFGSKGVYKHILSVRYIFEK